MKRKVRKGELKREEGGKRGREEGRYAGNAFGTWVLIYLSGRECARTNCTANNKNNVKIQFKIHFRQKQHIITPTKLPLFYLFSTSFQHLLERYGMTELGMVLSNPLHGVRTKGCVGHPLSMMVRK